MFVFLFIMALISVGRGLQNALNSSGDFQWSGSHLLTEGVDPYQSWLNHDPQHPFLYNQVPNYLPQLYFLLAPIGSMSFEHARAVWAGLNIAFAAAALYFLGRTYSLEGGSLFLLVTLFACGTPFRNALGMGQHSIFELALLAFILFKPAMAALPLGLSYFKYSFSPIIFFYAAARRAWKALAFSLLVPIAGALIFWMAVGGRFLHTLFEPLLVARSGVSTGIADMVSYVRLVKPEWTSIAAAVGLLLSAVLAFWIARQIRHLRSAAPAIATVDLILMPHLGYDFVLLAIPVAYLLSLNSRSASWWVAAACIVFFWYGLKLVPRTSHPAAEIAVSMAVAVVLFVSLLRLGASSQNDAVSA